MTADEIEDHEADIVTVEFHAGDKITKDLKLTPPAKL
jgi:hypothetical protein